MTSRSKRRSSLKSLIKNVPSNDEMGQICLELKDYDDYAAVVVGLSLLDRALQFALLGKLIQLSSEDRDRLFSDGENAPLSTLSSKIAVAHALGLYGAAGKRMKDDLDDLRNIRNVFAHSARALKFESSQITDIIDNLQFFSNYLQIAAVPSKDKFGLVVAYLVAFFNQLDAAAAAIYDPPP